MGIKFWLCRYEIYFKANKINSCSIIIMSIANSFFCFMLIWVLRPFCFLHLFLHFFRMSVLAAADRDYFVHRFLSFCFFLLQIAPCTDDKIDMEWKLIVYHLEFGTNYPSMHTIHRSTITIEFSKELKMTIPP